MAGDEGLPSRHFSATLQSSVGSNSTNSVASCGRQTLALLSRQSPNEVRIEWSSSRIFDSLGEHPGLEIRIPTNTNKKLF